MLHGIVLTTRDVTERRQLEEQLTDQAFHDSLTGLPNRALFGDRLEHARRRARRAIGDPIAVLFIDLDDFKAVNDTLGHREGDELLRHVATELAACVRRSDTVARLGGDEFAVLMEDATVTEALEAADRIQQRLRYPVWCRAPRSSSPRASASRRPTSTSVEARSSCATPTSRCTARRPTARPATSCSKPTCTARSSSAPRLLTDLRHALERGEMEVYYQPIVELASLDAPGSKRSCGGATASAGMIDPIEFINLAEQTGLIVPIGEFVLEEACRQLVAWDGDGIGSEQCSVSVNVSGRQLAARDLVDDGRARAADDRARTRSGSRSSSPRACCSTTSTRRASNSQALKQLGVKLAIDDFGTGYSSLSYLRHLPVDYLKIDRSFIESLDGARAAADLVRAIIDLGQRMQLTTVAEGIETPEQAGFLTGAGCRLAQGYYFCRPLSGLQVPDYLRVNPSRRLPRRAIVNSAPVVGADTPDIAAAV